MDTLTRRSTAVRALAAALAVAASGVRAADTVLVARPAGADFDEARKGIAEALGPGWVLVDHPVAKDAPLTDFVKAWRATRPKALVLMDNRSVGTWRDAAAALADTATPAVALMGVRLDLAVQGLPRTIAVAYEIPAVTSVVNLRTVVNSPVRRVGVVYRASWESFFRRQEGFCAAESVELVGRSVPDGDNPGAALREALGELLEGPGRVDALWVLNDNALLTPRLIQSIWAPFVRRTRTLAVVGVEPLVQPALDFGSFAVLPDNYALGGQVAGLLQDIHDAGWKIPAPRVEQPLSVLKILNLRQVRRNGAYRSEHAGEIDRILE